jgi:hypothetical protein
VAVFVFCELKHHAPHTGDALGGSSKVKIAEENSGKDFGVIYFGFYLYTGLFTGAAFMRENAGNGSTRCRCQFRFPVSVFYGAGAYV